MKHGLISGLAILTLSCGAMADDSIQHSGQASKHSVLAATESVQTTASVASAVSVAPVVLSVGVAVIAADSAHSVHHSIEKSNKPLPVTKRVNTADPAPNVVINQTIVTQGKTQ